MPKNGQLYFGSRVHAEDDYLNQFAKRTQSNKVQYWIKENSKNYVYDPYQAKNGYSIGMGKRTKYGQKLGLPRDEVNDLIRLQKKKSYLQISYFAKNFS